MSKTSRSLWAIAAIGITSRLPEQPSARENHRKSIGSGHQASRCCKEVLSWFCQGVTWTTWPLTRWWLVCGRSSLSRSFLQTSKFKCPFPRWEWVKKQKQVKQGWHFLIRAEFYIWSLEKKKSNAPNFSQSTSSETVQKCPKHPGASGLSRLLASGPDSLNSQVLEKIIENP